MAYNERLLENGSHRLLEDGSTYRALEHLVVIPSSSLTYGSPSVHYIQNESPYLRCNVCNRKSYQVQYAGVACNAWNSAPSLHPLQHCPGVLVASAISTTPQRGFQFWLQERVST